jgi:hypothetical protein
VKISRDALVGALLDQRFYLLGDEDCGVSLYCRECPDGGRPLAYHSTSEPNAYQGDPKVAKPSTIAALFGEAANHLTAAHRAKPDEAVNDA